MTATSLIAVVGTFLTVVGGVVVIILQNRGNKAAKELDIPQLTYDQIQEDLDEARRDGKEARDEARAARAEATLARQESLQAQRDVMDLRLWRADDHRYAEYLINFINQRHEPPPLSRDQYLGSEPK